MDTINMNKEILDIILEAYRLEKLKHTCFWNDDDVIQMAKLAEQCPYPFHSSELTYFPKHSSNRWSWFLLSKGYLWSSGKRKKFIYDYCRDYSSKVFKRYVRRYGYLSSIKAIDHHKKIESRWKWQSKAYIYLPDHKYGTYAEGDYCPVGYVGWCTPDAHYYYYEECSFCGGKIKIKEGTVYKKGEKLYDLYPERNEEKIKCENIQCNKALIIFKEAALFMRGRHPLIEIAKKINVYPKRKMNLFRDANDDEKLTIATACFLDFEARYLSKKDSLNSSKRCSK